MPSLASPMLEVAKKSPGDRPASWRQNRSARFARFLVDKLYLFSCP
jgi:hypothetical protein